MNPRRHILAMVVGGLLLLLFLGVGYLLFLKIKDYRAADSQLQGTLNQQQELYNRSPFPSPDNIAREQANQAVYKEEFAKLLKLLSEAQMEPVEQKPAAFNDQFWKILKELKAEAKSKNVELPEEFAFGFQRHMAGNLPPHPDVPRLTQQLLIMQSLCHLLFESKITELKSVIREEFEGGATESLAASSTTASRRGRSGSASTAVSENPFVKDTGIIQENALYGKMHFGFSFSARESVVRDLLNQIAKHPMVIVVTHLEITASDVPALKTPQGSSASAGSVPEKPETTGVADESQGKSKEAAAAGTPDRDQRILCGRENAISVILELDVYRFRKSEGNTRS